MWRGEYARKVTVFADCFFYPFFETALLDRLRCFDAHISTTIVNRKLLCFEGEPFCVCVCVCENGKLSSSRSCLTCTSSRYLVRPTSPRRLLSLLPFFDRKVAPFHGCGARQVYRKGLATGELRCSGPLRRVAARPSRRINR